MYYSTRVVASLALFSVASASPIFKRVDPTDVKVFFIASALEDLEFTFYKKSNEKFKDQDFINAGFTVVQVPLEQFKSIQDDEETHLQSLNAALTSFGEKPLSTCQFNLDATLKDVTTMAATARVFEAAGVGAYLGALHLMKDPRLMTIAATIGSTEARHHTVTNLFSRSGTIIASPFDLALNPEEVLSLVAPIISGCDLGIKANPTLSITNTDTPKIGTLLTFQSDALNNGSTSNFFCQMMVGNSSFSIPLPLSNCVVPEGINGAVAIWVTSDIQPLQTNPVDRANRTVVAGPALAFIDSQPQAINQLIIGGNGAGNATVASLTISPGESTPSQTPSPTTNSPNAIGETTQSPPPNTTPPASPTASPLSPPQSSPSAPTQDGGVSIVGGQT